LALNGLKLALIAALHFFQEWAAQPARLGRSRFMKTKLVPCEFPQSRKIL
jgi:hypothetical protein